MDDIRLLDSGTDEADELAFVTREALGLLGRDEAIERTTDAVEISSYGLFLLPALVVNEHVVCHGDVPDPETLAREMQKRLR